MTDADRPGPLPAHLDPRPGRSLPPSGRPGRALPPHLDPRGAPPRGGLPRIARSTGPDARPQGTPVPPPLRSGRRRFARVASYVALGLSLVLFAVAGVGYVLFQRYDGNIARLAGITRALPGLAKPASAPRDAKNVLLVGSDTRDTTGSQFQGKGASFTSGQRSDTVILAHLYAGSNQAQLVSFPRDSYVTIPAFTDPKTAKAYPQHQAKLNSAIEEGGPGLLIATIERLTNIRVDNYVQIDFAGFQNMVQTLGGVEICLTHNAKESNSGINLKAGRQVVNGSQALAFVRQRYGLPNGDLDRIKRQQAFIGSITRKVLSSGTLLDPFKLNSFLNAATRSVQVDDTLSASGLTSLALRLKSFNAGGVTFTTLPVADIAASRDNQSVVLLDQAKMDVLFQALRADRAPGETPPPVATTAVPTPLTVAPRSVRVSVLNGAGVAGLGRTAATDLARAGFVVVGAPGNSGTGATGTVIRYGPTRAESARTLAAALTGSTLQADPALGSTVEVVVGSTYAGVVGVSVASSPTAPAPAPSASAAPATTAASDGCVA